MERRAGFVFYSWKLSLIHSWQSRDSEPFSRFVSDYEAIPPLPSVFEFSRVWAEPLLSKIEWSVMALIIIQRRLIKASLAQTIG